MISPRSAPHHGHTTNTSRTPVASAQQCRQSTLVERSRSRDVEPRLVRLSRVLLDDPRLATARRTSRSPEPQDRDHHRHHHDRRLAPSSPQPHAIDILIIDIILIIIAILFCCRHCCGSRIHADIDYITDIVIIVIITIIIGSLEEWLSRAASRA